MKLNNFVKDCSGIAASIIVISFTIMSSIIWLVGELILNRVFDAFQPILATCQPQALTISQNALDAYGMSIVIVDVLYLVYWNLSAFKSESQESPGVRF